MLGHGGDMQAKALEMAIEALEKQLELGKIFRAYYSYGLEESEEEDD